MISKIFLRNRVILLVDIFLIVVAVLGSFALRLELGPLFTYYLPQAASPGDRNISFRRHDSHKIREPRNNEVELSRMLRG